METMATVAKAAATVDIWLVVGAAAVDGDDGIVHNLKARLGRPFEKRGINLSIIAAPYENRLLHANLARAVYFWEGDGE